MLSHPGERGEVYSSFILGLPRESSATTPAGFGAKVSGANSQYFFGQSSAEHWWDLGHVVTEETCMHRGIYPRVVLEEASAPPHASVSLLGRILRFLSLRFSAHVCPVSLSVAATCTPLVKTLPRAPSQLPLFEEVRCPLKLCLKLTQTRDER